MAIHIALLRGVNVGGAHKLPMQLLRDLAVEAGAGTVNTYIQSGNMVFSCAPGALADFHKKLSQGLKKACGFEPFIYLAGVRRYRTVLAKNPFVDAQSDASKMHVAFAGKLPKPALRDIESVLAPSEALNAIGGAVYFHAPDGIGRSKAAARLAQGLPDATMRNWRTCLKIDEMARDMKG